VIVAPTTTAAVPDGGAAIPGGSVQFLQPGGTPFGDRRLLENGRATVPARAHAGTYTMQAFYNGDDTFAASTGAADMVVDRANTATTVASSANPASVGGTLSLTIIVSTVAPGGVAPAGTVDILLNGLDVSGPIPLFDYTLTASGVVVSVPSEFLAQPGSATIAASYSGDADTRPSLSDGLMQSVTGPAPTPAPSPVPTVKPTPQPPTTASALSAMTATLTRALARRGIGALTTTKQRLSVTGPGTLVQRIYSPAAPAATTSAAKPVLIAKGSHTFSAAGTGTLTLRLTSAGRRAVRNRASLRIEIVTRFSDPSGASVTSAKRLTVRSRARAPRWASAAPARSSRDAATVPRADSVHGAGA
jgi:hypothetical protein